MTSALREHLGLRLQRKVDAHGLVVWDDPAREYVEVAPSVCPSDVQLVAWEGSWYAVRHRIEATVAGENPPRLIIYAPTKAPESDPLAEIRDAGIQFTLRLETLVKNALAGQLIESRLAQIGRQAETLPQAEAALAGGDDADVRLISALGEADTTRLALAILTADKTDVVDHEGLWPEAAQFLNGAFGAEAEGLGDELRQGIMRHLLLTELHHVLGDLPTGLAAAWSAPEAEARDRALTLLDVWRCDRRTVAEYAVLAAEASSDLALGDSLGWHDSLAALDSAPAIEQLALAEALRHLAAEEFSAARELAVKRLESSLWAREALRVPLEGAEQWGPRWRVVRHLAELRQLGSVHPPQGGVADQLAWYVSAGWLTDQAHRQLELALSDLHAEGDLEPQIADARAAYERWLENVLERFTSAVADDGLDSGQLLRQAEIHDRFVKAGSRSEEGPVAYIWADALRYELGAALVASLERACEEAELRAAVAAAPTVTAVGMANLCPGAATGLEVDLDNSVKLVIRVGDTEVKGVPEREDLLRAAHGDLASFRLDEVLQQGEKQLAKAIKGKSLVLVRSQEMDAAGESGILGVAWPHFKVVTDQLARAVAKLGQAGVSRFVICADHGFIALSRPLDASRTIYAPTGGTGHQSRRAWTGRGGTTTDNALRVPLAQAGVRSDLDLIVPRGLAVFSTGGGRQFFHGGLSPQELIVPVIVARAKAASPTEKLDVTATIAGDRITTGVFSATIALQPSLFTPEVGVRVLIRREADGTDVARVVAGTGYDAETGTITVQADTPSVITLQATANLDAGETVQLDVLDSRTDRRLASATAEVAAPVIVEDELD